MGFDERSGALESDARYLIRIPSDWNGVLLNDLDYADLNREKPSRAFLLQRGYGLSGTSRLQSRGRENIDNQLATLEAVTREFSEPRITVQIGCSGGGATALWMAERHADRIHGAIAQCGTSPAMHRHLWTDLLFVSRALLAPDTEAVVLGRYEPEGLPDLESVDLPVWRTILETAQATPLGRARIGLVTALSQLPTWGAGLQLPMFGAGFGAHSRSEPPDPADLDAVQASMAETLTAAISCAVAVAHIASAGHYSNVDVDFLAWYDNADVGQRRVVEELYAGLDTYCAGILRDDLARLQATPRLHRREPGLDAYWVTASAGTPGVPLLHVTTMDATTPPVLTGGYERLVRQNGLQDRYRSAYVLRASHCGFSVSETAALVDTLVDRVDSGTWPDASATELNTRAAAYGTDESRFIDHKPPVQNRELSYDSSAQ
jgi:pimeloyl-ACP methyl ester carboxylesterase